MVESSRLIAQCVTVGKSLVSSITDSAACTAALHEWDSIAGKCYTAATKVCGPLPGVDTYNLWEKCQKDPSVDASCATVTNPFSLGAMVQKGMGILFPFAGLILFGILVLGGYKFLTSGGDTKETQSAWAMITSALIGFFLLVVSYAAVATVSFVLGLDSPFMP